MKNKRQYSKLIFAFFLTLVLVLSFFLSFSFASAGTLKVTEEHPFLVNGSWESAKDLNVGDILQTYDGRQVRIKNITDVSAPENQSFFVYNLEDTLGINNYAAGFEGVIVHNSANIPGVRDFQAEFGQSSDELREFILGIENEGRSHIYSSKGTIRDLGGKATSQNKFTFGNGDEIIFYTKRENTVLMENEETITHAAFEAGIAPDAKIITSPAGEVLAIKDVNGQELNSFLRAQTANGAQIDSLSLAKELGSTMGKLRDAGILHRDLVRTGGMVLQEHFYVTSDVAGQPIKIIDFGRAETGSDLLPSDFREEAKAVLRAFSNDPSVQSSGFSPEDIKAAFEGTYGPLQ